MYTTSTTIREEEIMTDYQFRSIMKMVKGIIRKADSLEEAEREVDALILDEQLEFPQKTDKIQKSVKKL